MLDVMYEVPRRKGAGRYVIGDAVVRGHQSALDAGEKAPAKPSLPAADKPLEAAG